MSKKRNTVASNRTKGAVIAIVILLVIAAAGVGVLGYYSSGFSDWSRIESYFAADSGTPDDGNTSDDDADPSPDAQDPTPPAVAASYADLSVGNLIPTLYFNTDFDVKGYFADMYPYGLPQNFGIWFMSELYYQVFGSFEADFGKELCVVPLTQVDAAASDPLDIAILFDDTVVYTSSECSVNGVNYPGGWYIDHIKVLQDFSLDDENITEEVVFKAVAAQIVATSGLEHLRYFISQDDGIFYDESANIEDEGIRHGEMFDTLYFNTGFDVDEYLIGRLTAESLIYQPLMVLCIDGETALSVMSLTQLTGNPEDIDNIVIIFDCLVSSSGTSEQTIVYCSKDFSYKNVDYSAGWQCGELELDNAFIVDAVAGKNFLKFFVSYDGEFAAL